jgi:protein-disulfide isomerase
MIQQPVDLDYVCPFSAKMFNTLHTSIRPLLHKKYTFPGVRLVFRQQIQPWHPSSTLVHESGAAVLRLAPAKFWDYSALLFQQQTEYFDVNVVHESRNETYKRLAKLAAQVEGVDEGKVLELLMISDKPGPDGGLNSGNKVTDDVKQMVKANRVIGAHVTPTVFFNGVEERSIGSSWTTEQWEEWLDKNVT